MRREKFGRLTKTVNQESDNIADIKTNLDLIFNGSEAYREKFSTVASDRVIAMRRLDDLTNTLKIRSLRYKARSFCDYFVL